MRFAPVLLAGLGLLAGPAPAIAGPVWIHYRFDSSATPAPGGGAGSAKFQQHSSGAFAVVGDRPLATFRFLPAAPPRPLVPTVNAPVTFDGLTRFAMQVELTEDRSGEIGTVRLTGEAKSSWTWTPDGRVLAGPAEFLFDDSNPQRLWLGGHEFVVFGNGGVSTGGGVIQASVSVGLGGPDVQSAPEPGTAALAGIGLVGLAGAAVRRRGRLRPSS